MSDWVTFHILYPTAVKPVHREPKSSFLTDDCTEALKILLDLKQKGNYQRQDGIKALVLSCELLTPESQSNGLLSLFLTQVKLSHKY